MNDDDISIHIANGQGSLTVLQDAPTWPHFPQWCQTAAEAVAAHTPAYQNARPWEVTLRTAPNTTVQALNHQFRNINKPTNVLSFPNEDDEAEPRWNIGDIILATKTTEREAAEMNIPLAHHAQHLIVHGLLHLVGYDHMNPADAHTMESLEIKILATLNIPNPYEE